MDYRSRFSSPDAISLLLILICINIATSQQQTHQPSSSRIRFPGPSGYSPRYQEYLDQLEHQQREHHNPYENHHGFTYPNVAGDPYQLPLVQHVPADVTGSTPYDYQQWMLDAHRYQHLLATGQQYQIDPNHYPVVRPPELNPHGYDVDNEVVPFYHNNHPNDYVVVQDPPVDHLATVTTHPAQQQDHHHQPLIHEADDVDHHHQVNKEINVDSILFYPQKPLAPFVPFGSEPYRPRPDIILGLF